MDDTTTAGPQPDTARTDTTQPEPTAPPADTPQPEAAAPPAHSPQPEPTKAEAPQPTAPRVEAPRPEPTAPPADQAQGAGSKPDLFATRLRRSKDDRMLSGVCGGLARSLGIDALWLRLALVLATLLGFGVGVIIYLACWILMPVDDS